MNRKIICAMFLCFATVVTVSAQAQTLLPNAFGTWTAGAGSSQVAAPQAEQFAGEKAAVLREYGLESAEQRSYSGGADTGQVTLYRMVDPSAAYGAYTYLKAADMASLEAGTGASYSAANRDGALLVVGNLVLQVQANKARPGDADLKSLADGLARAADRRPYPNIEEFLPQGGLEVRSERYVLGPRALAGAFPAAAGVSGDWVGFGNSAEAIIADYHLPSQAKSQDAVMLISLYPTQQVAADVFNRMAKVFALNTDPAQTNGKPLVFGTRMGSLIAVLSGTDSREEASQLFSQIHYGSQVTWNEPSQSYSDPSISTMVVGAIMGSGAIMVLAIVAGVGFGGFRILMKLVLPGRVVDRDSDVEILQLGLSSKPVNAKDFYSLRS